MRHLPPESALYRELGHPAPVAMLDELLVAVERVTVTLSLMRREHLLGLGVKERNLPPMYVPESRRAEPAKASGPPKTIQEWAAALGPMMGGAE